MKTLKEHVILYDAVCPLCTLYTDAFVRSGMLDKEGRAPYQELPPAFHCVVNRKRAVNEIALVNRKTGEVFYGITSLFKIIGHSFPLFMPLFRFRPFSWIMGKVYRFISYNRRVIMPAGGEGGNTAYQDPSFHLGYRLAFLLFSWLLTSFILSRYSALLPEGPLSGNFAGEAAISGGQILWQFAFIRMIRKEKTWDYLGTLMTVSLAGALLLLPFLTINSLFGLHPFVAVGGFGAVVGLMFCEHIRRSRLLKLGIGLTASWVLYRIFLLLILL